MSLSSDKFTNPLAWDNSSEFSGKGNYGQQDVPGLSVADMQKVMDELPRYIASRVNEMIDDLLATTDGASGADQIGATALTGGTATTVQGILEELKAAIGGGGGGGSVTINSGTSAPTGGNDGDVYIQYAS